MQKVRDTYKWKRQGAIILMVAVALATGAATVYSLSLSPLTQQRSSPTPSASKVAVDAVAALGYLEPQGEVIHLSAPAFMEGARVEQLLVKRGDKIKAGQVIAILDSRDRLQAALQQAQKQVRVAIARLEQVKAENHSQGWILTEVFDGDSCSSEVWIFDADHLDAEPICRLALPSVIPFGFHGTWKSV